MLERSDWLITPWKKTSPEGGGVGETQSLWQRDILDRTTGFSLGFARRRIGSAAGFWPWTRVPRVELHEVDDASHLCTMERSWWGRSHWKVRDAEDTLVGKIFRNHLLDPWGRSHGRLDSDGMIRDAEDRTLAFFQNDGDALRVLLKDSTANPFWKMLLVCMAVLHDGPPPTD